MRVTGGLAMIGAVLVAAACGGGPPPAGSTGDVGSYLENATWHLRSIDDLRIDLEDGPWLRATSSDGRVQGSTGCNSFNGPYRAGGTTVTFGPLATTRRACPDPAVADVERRMLDILQSADGYRVDSGRLQIMIDGRIRMLFEAGPAR